jgi:hypothetical protein
VKYQHKSPQGPDDPDYHEEEPKPARGKRMLCEYCNQPLILVDENEGPESLKSLLRF